MSSPYFVDAALRVDLPAACRALAAGYFPPQRERQARAYLAPLTNGVIDPAGLFVAKDAAGVIVGAILTQQLGGAVGLVWPPGVEPAVEAEAIEDALVPAACAWLRSSGVKVAQALPRSGDRAGVPALERHGFQLVTRLCLWQRDLSIASRPTFSPGTLTFVPADDPEVFTKTLLATYEDSLDCPESGGNRTAEELAAAHGSPDAEDPLWFLAREAGNDVGVVMLTRSEPAGVGELTYLGLVPSARGRKLGRELLRFALARSVEAGFHNLTLSVDVRNEPAVQLYRGHGFRPYEWRDVYNVVWSDSH